MKISLLIDKLRRKFRYVVRRTVYHNYQYKPSGLFLSSKDFFAANKNEQTAYVEIYPNLVSKVNIDEQLYDACPNYFKPNLMVKTTYLVVKLPNARIHTDNATSIAIISADNKLVGDVSFSYNYGRTVRPQENNIFKQRYFSVPKKYKGTVFSMITGGSGINNYSHWLLDSLPRIHLLKKSGMYDQVDWFYIPAHKHDFQRDTLRLLGINEDKIIEADKFPHIEADVVIASTAPRGNDAIIPVWLCDFLRQSFYKKELIKDGYPPLIYISRKDSKFRNVSNEDELTEILQGYGFRTFVLSDLSFIEKMSLFATAKVVISATGAGMTNMVFSPEMTKVVEIFNEGFVVGPFYDLAPKCGLDYHYLICKTGSKSKNLKQGQEENVLVNVKQVQEMLEKILPEASVKTNVVHKNH